MLKLVLTGLFVAILGTNSFGGSLFTSTVSPFSVDPSIAQGSKTLAAKPSQQNPSDCIPKKRCKPPNIQHVANLVCAIQASVAHNPPVGEVVPLTEAPDEMAPVTILYRVIAELEVLLDSREQEVAKAGISMKFPTTVEATLLINSRGNNITGHACAVLRDAYDEAWNAP